MAGSMPTLPIKEQAQALGFSCCGVAQSATIGHLRPRYLDIVKKGVPPGLAYLEKYLEQRIDPSMVMNDVRSVIAVMLSYRPAVKITEEHNFIISAYAYGRDYHRVMAEKMKKLTGFMQQRYGPHHSRAFVDSGPVAEKAWAQRCGIGWQGKNTLIINKTAGSFGFIGIIFSELELSPDLPSNDHCGDCRRCVEACPAGALNNPYSLDIEKCISYQTIENRAPIRGEAAASLNGRIYGCDICQDVCPFNRHAASHDVPEFEPLPELLNFRKPDWNALTQEQFLSIFKESSIKRIGYEKFIGNIRAAAGLS